MLKEWNYSLSFFLKSLCYISKWFLIEFNLKLRERLKLTFFFNPRVSFDYLFRDYASLILFNWDQSNSNRFF